MQPGGFPVHAQELAFHITLDVLAVFANGGVSACPLGKNGSAVVTPKCAMLQRRLFVSDWTELSNPTCNSPASVNCLNDCSATSGNPANKDIFQFILPAFMVTSC